MTDQYRGHYMPVAARRRVLSIYRSRRATSTWSPFATGPLAPMAAMQETVQFCEGWLAEAAAFGPLRGDTVADLTDQYRAAQYYLHQMHAKPQSFWNHGRVGISFSEILDRAELAR